MTVGLYSPLPPSPTGVADYSATLLAGLRGHGRVEIAPTRCDVALYHMGNNGLHSKVYRRALERPGVVVLHDAVLQHFYLGQLERDQYVGEFVYNYGEWSRGLAEDLWRGRAASGADSRYFAYPMLKRIAEKSLAVVVHNRAAADAVAKHAPQARIVEIPHLAMLPAAPPTGGEVLRYRHKLGIDPSTFLFGVFGYLRESKRLASILEAFTKVRRELPHIGLLIAGRFVSTDLERSIEPLLEQPGIRRLPHLPERDFWLAASAVDACIGLRDPAAGETSGIAIRLMGIGKPVLLTDSDEVSGIPEDACIRIPAGPAERDSLATHLVLLTSINEVAATVGQRGAEHVRTRHRVDSISSQYWNVICEFCT